MRLGGEKEGRAERIRLLVIIALLLGGFIAFQRLAPSLDIEGWLEDVADRPRRPHVPVRRPAGVRRDRRLRRPRLPRRDGGDHRRRARRPGRELGRPDAGDRLVLRLGGRHGELPARPAAGARVRAAARAEGADHRAALRPGGVVLPAPRRQDDPDRAVHRPRTGAGAVHRRQLGDDVPRVRPLQRARNGPLGGDVHPPRLLHLREHQRGDRAREPRHLRLRRRGRDGRGAGARDQVPARAREPAAPGAADGGDGGAEAAGRVRAADRAGGAVPLASGDPWRPRARVHDADGGAGGGAVRRRRVCRDLRRRFRGRPRAIRRRSTWSTGCARTGSPSWRRS